MKDQYVGDVNDYLKYSLLRALTGPSAKGLLVCWMLTPPDDRSDGALTSYLKQPTRFRSVDPQVFDALSDILSASERSVDAVENHPVLPDARFDQTVVPVVPESRRRWMASVLDAAQQSDLVFFDPDNGLEVPSVRPGKKGSEKYLYWDELELAFRTRASVVVYQHFPRRPREPFLTEVLSRVQELDPSRRPFAAYTSRVAYLIAPRVGHDLLAPAQEMAKRWPDHLTVLKAER